MEPEKEEFRNDTPVNAPVKEKYRMEIRKLREMPFKKKVEYIWDYYRFHIIAILAVLLIIGGLINSIINPRPETALLIAWSTGFATEEQIRTLSDIIEDKIIDEKANEVVDITLFYSMSEDPSMDMANIQRLAAMVAARMIDVFILDSEMIDEYSSVGYLQPLDTLLSIVRAQNPNVYRRIIENLIHADFEDEDGIIKEGIMGVDITGSSLLKEIGFYDFDRIFCLSVTSDNEDNAANTLILLFE